MCEVKKIYTYNKLRARIIEVYGSQTNFAEAVGLSAPSVSHKMNGKYGFSQEDVERWAKLLGIHRCDYGEFFYT